jgi:predicted nucleic acid-binding protein
LLFDAVQIGLAHTLSTYDALYVALAQRTGAPLISADERLLRVVRGRPFDIRALATLDPSAL